MRLAGKNELHRALGIVHHRGQPFDVRQNQVGALVGGKAARKSDGQRVGAEHPAQSLQNFLAIRRGARPAPRRDRRTNSSSRDFRLRCVSQSSPSSTFSMPSQMRGFAAVLVPARSQMAVVKAEHLRRQPRGNVHAVGDVADGNCVFRLARDRAPSTWRAKLRRAAPKPHWRAATVFRPSTVMQKVFVLVVRILASQRHQAFVRKAQRFAQRPQMLFDQIRIEAVVTGRHGRVRGEDHFARNARHGLIERQCLLPPCGCESLPARRIRCVLRSGAERPA